MFDPERDLVSTIELASTSTPLYRRRVCERAGPWNPQLHNEEDWEYDCRVAALGVRLHFVPEFVS